MLSKAGEDWCGLCLPTLLTLVRSRRACHRQTKNNCMKTATSPYELCILSVHSGPDVSDVCSSQCAIAQWHHCRRVVLAQLPASLCRSQERGAARKAARVWPWIADPECQIRTEELQILRYVLRRRHRCTQRLRVEQVLAPTAVHRPREERQRVTKECTEQSTKACVCENLC